MVSGSKSKPRPASTSKLAVPLAETNSTSASLFAAFSPGGDFFAHVFPVLSKHALRIYDAANGRAIVEKTIENGRVTAMSWDVLMFEDDASAAAPSKKRKKRTEDVSSLHIAENLVLALGLTTGDVELFSLSQTRVILTLTDALSNSPITCLRIRRHSNPSQIWTCSEDGVMRVWNVLDGKIVRRWKPSTSVPYSALAFRPISSASSLLAGNTSISMFAFDDINTAPLSERDSSPSVQHEFHGHASPVTRIEWEDTSEPRRFVSMARGDRFANIWEVPGPASAVNDSLLASVPMDSELRGISLGFLLENAPPFLLALSSSQAGLFKMPSVKMAGTEIFDPDSIVNLKVGKRSPFELISASFVSKDRGKLRFACLTRGVKIVFVDALAVEGGGTLRRVIELQLNPDSSAQSNGKNTATELTRYREPLGLSVSSGSSVAPNTTLQFSELSKQEKGALDAEMAELSLGQRLSARANDIDQSAHGAGKTRDSEAALSTIPVNSLSRTLIQALHSSDARLLEMCLQHSNPNVIRNTVQHLPSQLALPLLAACVERLGRGHRGATGKGGGSGASAQRGTGLLEWIKAVLIVHNGYLMAIPDLNARLASLHTVLVNRLSLGEKLRALSGRLDFILTQMELRTSASLNQQEPTLERNKRKGTIVYREDESEEEEEDDMGWENQDHGDIEEVVIGGNDFDEASRSENDENSAEQMSDEEDEDEGSEDSIASESEGDSDESGRSAKELIDEEAVEMSSEEGEEEESE